MAPTRPSTEGNIPSAAPNSTPNGGIVKRRNRIPLSCESCRSRKLKCDRQKPCQNCKARDMAVHCIYAADEGAKASRSVQMITNPEDMGDRIQRLEALVGSLVKGPSGNSNMPLGHPGTDDPNGYPSLENALQPNGPYGAMVAVGEGHHFIGESHWAAVLRDITAIRESFEESKLLNRPPMVGDDDQPALLGGVTRMASRAELIGALPNKNLADRLFLRFWDAWDPSTPLIIHKPTFYKHIDEQWHRLEELHLPRIGIFFTMFAMALNTYQVAGDEPPDLRGFTQELSNTFRQRAAQCILASDVTASVPDSLTSLSLHWISEFYRLPRATIGLWMLQSLVVRKAILMGYHRDPSAFPSISILDGELRRRNWHAICQSDLLLSFHLGLPSMIKYSETDVAPPRSLYEEELYEGMEQLPPERPKSDPTPVAYGICKRHMFQVFGKVVAIVNSMKVPSDEQIKELNEEMADSYNNVHPHLRPKPLEDSMDEPSPIRLQRIQMQTFYHKAICVLNRRYLLMPISNLFVQTSRELCIDSALSLLEVQNSMHQAGYKWHTFLYNRNDFLLATVVVCLALYTSKKLGNQAPQQLPFDPAPQTEENKYRQVLERARQVWLAVSDEVPDARKAWNIIDSMLHQMGGQNKASQPSSAEPSVFSDPPTTQSLTNLTPDSSTGYADMDFTNVDWDCWDKIIQGTDFDTAQTNPEQFLQATWFGGNQV